MLREAIGLDIGGANLKAATATEALSIPFELWRHPERLAENLAPFRERWSNIANVAVTMTGELCDCFPTKRDGVRHILAAVEKAFPKHVVRVWSTTGTFVSTEEANEQHMKVAAANWHALATWVGRRFPDELTLLIDTGSTTTDIIPIWRGVPEVEGRSDSERLKSGELVYTGVRRTPVCAVLNSAVAAEWFATTHDVYVTLGLLPEDKENRLTADGRPMTSEHAHARLARMLGGDAETTSKDDTLALAFKVFSAQQDLIAKGIAHVLSGPLGKPEIVMISGSGEFLAQFAWHCAAATFGAKSAPVKSLSKLVGSAFSEAACAHAVAVLASEAESWD
ncbi:MAG TPA: hydantoinase/oxoprolinase family protein [Gemmataceae bacterium]|jgi:hypothetical protein|nr:hydantoinase/oxoprolinase family protein [Gemmataceae bacterium]